jgi:hypothetical protein
LDPHRASIRNRFGQAAYNSGSHFPSTAGTTCSVCSAPCACLQGATRSRNHSYGFCTASCTHPSSFPSADECTPSQTAAPPYSAATAASSACSGGALLVLGARLYVEGSHFSSNIASSGGAIYWSAQGVDLMNAEIKTSNFTDNRAQDAITKTTASSGGGRGGALFLANAPRGCVRGGFGAVVNPNGRLIEAPWLAHGAHGASLRRLFVISRSARACSQALLGHPVAPRQFLHPLRPDNVCARRAVVAGGSLTASANS